MPTMHIRVDDRQYWQCLDDGAVTARGPWPQRRETFTVQPVTTPADSAAGLPTATLVRILDSRNFNICLQEDGTLAARPWPRRPVSWLGANTPALAVWEAQVALLKAMSVFTLVIPPGGPAGLSHLGKFALRAANQKYVCAEGSGDQALIANRDTVGAWETFTADFHPEPGNACRTVHLRTADGQHFLQAVGAGGGDLNACGPAAGTWETFDLIACTPTSVGFPTGATVAVRTSNGVNYLQAENGGSATVNAKGPWQREWETFTLVLPAGVPSLSPGGRFSLMAADRSLVSAHGGEGSVSAVGGVGVGADQTLVDIDIVDPEGSTTVRGKQGAVTVTLTSNPSVGENVSETPRLEEKAGEMVCSVSQVKITSKFDDAMLLDPYSDVLWTGAVIDGARWTNGEYRPIVVPRAPMNLSLSLESYTGQPVAVHVDAPTTSTVRSALNTVRGKLIGSPLPARVQSEIEQVFSANQLQVSLGVGVSTGIQKLKAKFDFSDSSTTSKFVWRFQQVYYTVDMDLPGSSKDLFTEPRTSAPDEMYISSVTYGRTMIFTVESSEQSTDVRAAIDYSYHAGASVEAELAAHYSSIMQKSKVSLLILGGSAGAAEHAVTGGIPEIRSYINSGGTFTAATQAVPLSYRLRFVSDNALGNLLLTTAYTRRDCVKAVGHYRVQDMGIEAHQVSDFPGEDIELYGCIWVRGGIDGVTDHVPISPEECVWNRPKAHYLDLTEGTTSSIGSTPQLTFDRIHDRFRDCYVEVSAWLCDYDYTGANDRIIGNPARVYLSQVQAGDPPNHSAQFTGDGNIVNIHFKIVPVE